MQRVKSGDIIVLSDKAIHKFDMAGNEVWRKSIESDALGPVSALIYFEQASDGGILATGIKGLGEEDQIVLLRIMPEYLEGGSEVITAKLLK
jgi:hypothetical protein